MNRLLFLVSFLVLSFACSAQNSFRTRQSGDWNQSSTWEEFIAGSWQLTTNTPDFSSGSITLQSPHTITITASITIDETTIQSGATLTQNDLVVVTLNNVGGTSLTISGILDLLGESFINGAGSLTVSGVLRIGSLNPTGGLITGTTAGNIRTTGLRTILTGSTFAYGGSGAQFIGNGHPGNFAPSGVITVVDNVNGVSFDANCGSNFSGGGTLYIPGNLVLTQGDLNIVSAIGVTRTLYLTALIIDNGNSITIAGPSVNLTIGGTGNLSFPSPPGLQSVGNITISRPGNTISFPSPFSVTTRMTSAGNVSFLGTGNTFRDIVVNSGYIDFEGSITATGLVTLANSTTIFFEGQTLTMAGNFVTSGGVLSSNLNSTLSLTGTGAFTSPLIFSGGSALNTLTMNKSNAGTSATIGSPLTLTTALNLSAGTLSIVGGGLSLSNGATITKSSLASIITSSPTGGPWNLTYTGSSQSTGLEIPASGLLSSVTVNTVSSTNVTLTQDITVSNFFSISSNSRSFTCGTNNVAIGSLNNSGVFNAPTSGATIGLTVSGNFLNTGIFNHNSGTIIIDGACVMSGTNINVTDFSTINISGTGALTAPTTLNILGNLSNSGSFVAGAGNVVFKGGISNLLGTNMPATIFNQITVNPLATLVPASNLILLGNLIMNGGFTAGTGTVTFNGASTLSGTNANNVLFAAIKINAGSSLIQAQTTFNIGGHFTNDGIFNAGSGHNVTFTGTSALSGTTMFSTDFTDVIILGGATVFPPSTTFRITGSFTNGGTFTAGTGTVYFTGNGAGRTISGANSQFFGLTIDKSNGGPSVILNSAQTVTNALTLTDGILSNGSNLTLSSGASLTKSSNGTLTAIPAGGPWDLTYLVSSQSTSFEIPASGLLRSLTIGVDNTRSVTLTQSITVQNQIWVTAAGRSLICGTNNVTAGSVDNSGTFVAPGSAATTGLTVSGNFANSGTFTHNSGLTTFSGATNLSGPSLTTFNRLTISGTLNTLTNFAVAGHFTNNGGFIAGAFTVTFSGTALQNISGTAPSTIFNNLTITNTFSPVSVSIEHTVNLIGILTMGASAKLDADGSAGNTLFVLLSTSDSPAVDASIAALPASAQVNGNVTVQRFFRPKDNFDRFISSPVATATVAQIQASSPVGSFPITGGFVGTSFPCAGCVNDGDNLRYYREADTGIINKGYIGWITSTSSILVPGVGYDAFMWNGIFNTTVGFRGTINRGSINLGIVTGPPSNSITKTANGVPSADGWNLVGNPYPSAIQWNNGPGWTRANIDPTVWVWDVIGRVWHSFNANTSAGDLTNGIIASGQGFWVNAVAVGTATITVNEQAKSVMGTGSYFRERTEVPSTIKISLGYRDAVDNSFIVFNEQATRGYDNGLDATKLQLGIEQVSVSVLDDEQRRLGHFAVGKDVPDRLPLYVFGDNEGEYRLSFEMTGNFPLYDQYYLIDSYLGESSLIASGKPYTFTMTATEIQTMGERFYLSTEPLAENIAVPLVLTCSPNPTSDQISILVNSPQVADISFLDNSGRILNQGIPSTEGRVSRATIDVSKYPAGLYIVKVIAEGRMLIKKVIIKH